MRDPSTVAAVVSILRQVYGDDLARTMLNDGVSLAVLIDALLRSSMKNRDAVRLLTGALSSGDFTVTPFCCEFSALGMYLVSEIDNELRLV